MFRVEELQFGRVSWYYQEVANDASPGDMSGGRFTPLGLGARWILRASGWGQGARVVDLGAGHEDLEGRLISAGVEVVPAALVSQGYVDGGYLICNAESAWDIVASGKLDSLPKLIFPFGRVFFAVEVPFAGNRGFERVLAVMQQESHWLGMPNQEFVATVGDVPRELAIESPALLARVICARLRAETDIATPQLKVDRFSFDPDIMTTPMGQRVVSHDVACQLAEAGGEKADRRGIVLCSLTRTAKV